MKRLFLLLIFIVHLTLYGATITIDNSASEGISDNACFNKTFSVSESGSINTITIEVNIDHTWRADLDIALISPSSTNVNLTSDNGGNKDNLYVLFDDAAGTSITSDNDHHTVTVTRSPEASLSAFAGENTFGTWTLQICDDAGSDVGTYNYSKLHIDYTPPPPLPNPLLEYKMDECYWLASTGSPADVKDSSSNHSDARVYNDSYLDKTDAKINFSGHFITDNDYIETEDTSVGNTAGSISVSFWVKLDSQMSNWAAVVLKTKPYNWSDGWGFGNPDNSASDNFRFYVGDWNGGSQFVDDTLSVADGWTHFVGTYDATTIRLYKNGVLVNSIVNSGLPVNSVYPIRLGHDTSASGIATLKGNLDELKVWDSTLSEVQISQLYSDEVALKNYDGTLRETVVCSTSISAKTWEMVSIPADLRSATNKDVADIFEEFPSGSYADAVAADRWSVYKRTYSDTNNSSKYVLVPYTGEALVFGQGYFLGSGANVSWSENTLPAVNYDSVVSGCTAQNCVEIDVKSASLDGGAGDNLLGTGSYRYNLSGFVGHSAVKWADCRFVVDGTVYTPTAVETAGYAAATIWQFNPGPGDYSTCDDTASSCKLEPYKAFWVELHGLSKGKVVKLLIPQE